MTDARARAERFADLFRAVYRGRGRGAHEPGPVERQTLDYMATMPAWRDHPRVTTARQGS